VNVVADREVAPEFVQDAVVAGAMADALEPLLDESSDRRRIMRDGLADVRARLGSPGAAGRVAEIALALARSERPAAPAAAAVP
jgi:lipid-A-disaccharide synthase